MSRSLSDIIWKELQSWSLAVALAASLTVSAAEAAPEEIQVYIDDLLPKGGVGLDVHELASAAGGRFFSPVLAEIAAAGFLQRELFGPILHVVRCDANDLAAAAAPLAGAGYGLTLGVHSRIEAFAEQVRSLVPAGDAYVNRSMIGAVVGVQPFGGEGLSGTGPKAGGPNALLRYAVERAVSVNTAAQGGDPALLNL